VIARPGQTPRSPLTMVEPVLVTVEPPRTAKLAAVPSPGAIAASGCADALIDRPANKRDIIRMIEIVRYFSLCTLFGLLPKTSHLRIQV
jgi:hypothetical protein